MKTSVRKNVLSKWLKTKAILKDPKVRMRVPETRRMNEKSLGEMLRRYSMVYIKPEAGTYGKGVMRVEQGNDSYSYQEKEKKRVFDSFPSMYRSIVRTKRKRPYLVQKGIHLLKYKGRRFDIRVMVQRNHKHAWEMTGMIGRVAHPRKIVTNYHSGGKPTEVRTLLKPFVSGEKLSKMEKTLSKAGYDAAKALSRTYPGLNMVGADIGLDNQLRPWIIELNTNPDPYIFRHLADKSIARKVLSYASALKRIPPSKSKAKRYSKRSLSRNT
ncbi:endospore coat-associated protein [Paenibacillus sp. KS1]|uniref:YheC/YheD family protein n=1 Tax=Paenibacillus sp. KS1 TaxID=1849249 RepID=UPI0008065A43|nr:YheC/YheD family protein [Paenibacillus sp. KS1]OBY76838.1 endospore coat-associated protein [Paenibacillus sp. KS1]